MIKYKDIKRSDLFSVFELTYNNATEDTIEGYMLDPAYWASNVLSWLAASEKGEAIFKLAFYEDKLAGFLVGLPTSWHYSDDIYLELKEVIVDESLSKSNKVRIVKEFAEIAEEEARKNGLKGLSAFSIRNNSQAYSNFFCKRLGWTPCSGAKKIF